MAENTKHGLWSVAGVPHKGWSCVDYFYLDAADDEETEVCQMCQSSIIRNVHVVEHDDYEGQLQVGCICAIHLTEDKKATEEREKTLKSVTGKITRLRNRKELWLEGWSRSLSGNLYFKEKGFVYIAKRQINGFSFNWNYDDDWHNDRAVYKNIDELKNAAFKHYFSIRKRWILEEIDVGK